MAFWNKKEDDLNYADIISVVILEQTQLYTNSTQRSYSHEPFTWDNLRVIDVASSIPSGAEITFSVTFKGGRQEIVKAKSGTDKCSRLLQMAIDPKPTGKKLGALSSDECEAAPTDKDEAPVVEETESPITIGKNQLPHGVYEIGKDIPAGTYDFEWIWGDHAFMLHQRYREKSQKGSVIESVTLSDKQTYSFYSRQWLNVTLNDGEFLVIESNAVVSIKRSKGIELEL